MTKLLNKREIGSETRSRVLGGMSYALVARAPMSARGKALPWPLAEFVVSDDLITIRPRRPFRGLVKTWQFRATDVDYVTRASGILTGGNLAFVLKDGRCVSFSGFNLDEIIGALSGLGVVTKKSSE
jgi:hypothetical protein